MCSSANDIDGIQSSNGQACCPLACGQCGGVGCGAAGNAAGTDCCISSIVDAGDSCSVKEAAPCKIDDDDNDDGR